MATTAKWKDDLQSLLTTVWGGTDKIASLANGFGAISDKIDHDPVQAAEGSMLGDIELLINFATAPTAYIACYVIRTVDGTNFEKTTAGTTEFVNPQTFVGNFVFDLATGSQRAIIRGVVLPPDDFKLFVVNNSGQAADSGAVIRIKFYTPQSV